MSHPRLDLIEIFCKYNYSNLYAIPRHIFLHYANKMPRILLVSTYAMACIYLQGLEYYFHARKLVDDYVDAPSPLIVFALFLLITYSTLSGKCTSILMTCKI